VRLVGVTGGEGELRQPQRRRRLAGQPEKTLQAQNPLQRLRSIPDGIVEATPDLSLAEAAAPGDLRHRQLRTARHLPHGVPDESVWLIDRGNSHGNGLSEAREPVMERPLRYDVFPWRGALPRPDVAQEDISVQQLARADAEEQGSHAGAEAYAQDLGASCGLGRGGQRRRAGDERVAIAYPDDVDAAVGEHQSLRGRRSGGTLPETLDHPAQRCRWRDLTVRQARSASPAGA
jgi:hypothetical protein